MYDITSSCADDFINHEEILDTLAYADQNKENSTLIDSIIQKAKKRKGLSHREASVLLACPIPEKNEEIFRLAEQIKKDFYGNRIVMFAPLYLSNYCINGCTYCPYHAKNKHIARKQLSQEEIRKEVIALQDMGHKRLALEAGEDPVRNTMDYYLECIRTIYSIHHRNGAIRRVNINIAATTVDHYRLLKEAGIGTYILFQETYHKESYLSLHPTGPKHDYNYHTEAMDRAMQGGIDDVGLGVLFGLDKYRYEFAGLLMHAEHLEAAFGVGPHTISVPRLRRADDIDPDQFDNGIDDDTFAKIVACIRIAVPYTGMIISTRRISSQENVFFILVFLRSAADHVPASVVTANLNLKMKNRNNLMSATPGHWMKSSAGLWKWIISPASVLPVTGKAVPVTASCRCVKVDRSRTAATQMP